MDAETYMGALPDGLYLLEQEGNDTTLAPVKVNWLGRGLKLDEERAAQIKEMAGDATPKVSG